MGAVTDAVASTDKPLSNWARGACAIHSRPAHCTMAASGHVVALPMQTTVAVTHVLLALGAILRKAVPRITLARGMTCGVGHTDSLAAAVAEGKTRRLREHEVCAVGAGPAVVALTAPDPIAQRALPVAAVTVVGGDLAALAGESRVTHTRANGEADTVARAGGGARRADERAVDAMETVLAVAGRTSSVDMATSPTAAAVWARHKGRAVLGCETGVANTNPADTLTVKVAVSKLDTLADLTAVRSPKSTLTHARPVVACLAVARAQPWARLELARLAAETGVPPAAQTRPTHATLPAGTAHPESSILAIGGRDTCQ